MLVLKSVHALEGVRMSVADLDGETTPTAMRSSNDENKEWLLVLDEVPTPAQRIRLVASSASTQYFGDASTLFIKRS